MSPSRRDSLREPGHEGLFRRSVLLALGQGSVGLLFVVYVIAARSLGVARFGEFSLGMTIATLLFGLPAWGTIRYASILAAREPGRTEEILASSLGLTIPLTLVYFPLVWLASVLVAPQSPVVGVALLLGVDLVIKEYGNLLRLLLRVHDGFTLDAATVFAERGLMVAGALTALLVYSDPVSLAFGFALGRGLGASVTTAVFVGHVCSVGVRFEGRALWHLLRGGTPLALRRTIGSLSFRVDMLFLGIMRSSREVGWYGSVYALLDGLVMIPNVVTASLAPTLSANFGEGNRDVVKRLHQRGLKYVLIVGLFLAALFGALAESVVAVVYGSEYAPAAAALRLLSMSVVFIFVRRHVQGVLDNVDLRGVTVWVVGVGLATNVALNLALIPRFGYMGAAASTVVTEAYLMGAMLWILQRAAYPSAFLRQLRAPAFAIGPSVVSIWMLADTPLIAALAGGIVYVGLLTALGAWDDKDRLLFRSVAAAARGRSRE